MSARDRWYEVDELFGRVLDLPPEERRAFVVRFSPEDPGLRAAVEELLTAAEAADSFLERPIEDCCALAWTEIFTDRGGASPGNGARARDGEDSEGQRADNDGHAGAASNGRGLSDRSGERVGPYRLVRRIGRGGMASVYLAERADGQFEQSVAIKLLRRGVDTEDVVRRFVAERQILSSLDHPNIARLLDGGATEAGLPYLVMEYVEGTPIVSWCDERRLPVAERLRLFCDVGRAVQHAHRSLVVHRDLKPSNILVDDEGRVKLLDFGIAKLLDSAGGALGTRTVLPPLTPEYASPEQVCGEPITTGSDVYQLGIVLCQLLSGHRPYEVRALSAGGMERAISTARPRRPSERVTEETAGARAARAGELRRALRGDLDVIALKALRREPEARYESAAALIEDVERHLAGRPVAARHPSLLYETRKLLGRRPWIVPAAAAALLAIGAYVFTLERHATQLERERNLAREEAETSAQMAGFLADLFLAANPLDGGVIRSAADVVDFGIARADSALGDRPELHLKLLTTLGRSAYWLGQLETARSLLERTGRLEAELAAPMDPLTAWWANQYLGAARFAQADYEAAEASYLRALELSRSALGPGGEYLGRTLNVLGWLYHEVGDLERAERAYREAGAIHLASSGWASPDYATALENLGLLFADQGHLEAGEVLVRQALAVRRASLGPGHPNLAFGLRSLGRILYRRGEAEEAEALLREALDMRRRVLGPAHHKFAEDVAALGTVLAGRGEVAEGRRLLQEALVIRRESLGDAHPITAVTRHELAALLHRSGERERAEALYLEAIAALSDRFGASHGWTLAAAEDLERLRAERLPAARDWLSGTRLALPAPSNVNTSFLSMP